MNWAWEDQEDGSTAPFSSFLLQEEVLKSEEILKKLGVLLASSQSNMG